MGDYNKMMNFNDLSTFSVEEINELIDLSRRLDEMPEPRSLEGKVLSLLFFSPSLRTLASFQAAMTRLGGGTFVISPEMSIYGLESRSGIVMDGIAAEHVHEAVPVIAAYGDAIGIRALAKVENLDNDLEDRDFNRLTALVDKPFINMESAIHHPCQSLADWKTLNDLSIGTNRTKFVLSWTQHPDALPLAVPSSTLNFAALRGMDVTVLRPDGFELPETVMERSRELAQAGGGTVNETSNRAEAMEGASVVYASTWSSSNNYGKKIEEEKLKSNLRNWCVEEAWFDNALNDCRFMHCLPARRGVTVSDQILDGPRSVVIPEARNRMLVQMAVLHQMLASST